MGEQNKTDNNKDAEPKAARITGYFILVAAVISGIFLIVNTLAQQGLLDFGLGQDPNYVTPVGSPLLVQNLEIVGSKVNGVTFTAPQNGTYIFAYDDSAVASWPTDDSAGETKRWSTMVMAFRGSTPVLANDGIDIESSIFSIGNTYNSKDEAIKSTVGEKIALKLNAGDEITIVSFDCSSCYFDNSGSVFVNVYYYP